MTTIKHGDRVRMHYTTFSIEDCMIETSTHREPLEFRAGGWEVIPGISHGVIGMKVGDKLRLPVMPEHAFGYRQNRWQQTAPRAGLPERLSDGDQLLARVAGVNLDVWIKSFQGEEVVLDANHPLAGESLIYEIEIIQVESEPE